MLFNSSVFLVFFCIFFPVYLLLGKRLRAQNAWLLLGGYVFYGWWSLKFLALLIFTTLIDYLVGLGLHRFEDEKRRKTLLVVSLATNIGILAIFKYFNFFADSLVDVLNALGFQAHPVTLRVILPIGISFYTFQEMSYTIDVYLRRMKPCRNLLEFATFVAFFPPLVAGPIERARRLLPQVQAPRRTTPAQVNDGLWLILFGYFKKLVIADNVSTIADLVFAPGSPSYGIDLLIGLFAFTVQIYGDFSGYSDIARGLAKLLGFEILINFKLPYFARNPSDFWARWHIALSSWIRDYLYIPLGGSRHGELRTHWNLFITMAICGLWHGAAWNFVVWGIYHGLLSSIYRVFSRPVPRGPNGERLPVPPTPRPIAFLQWAVMLVLTIIGWALFRAESLPQAWHILTAWTLETTPWTAEIFKNLAFATLLVFIFDIWLFITGDLLAPAKLWLPARVLLYAAMLFTLMILASEKGADFIYFQF